MKLPELKSVASGLGIKGISAMRKGDLIAAIQSAGSGQPQQRRRASRPAGEAAPAAKAEPQAVETAAQQPKGEQGGPRQRRDEQRGDEQKHERAAENQPELVARDGGRPETQRHDAPQGEGGSEGGSRNRRRRARDRTPSGTQGVQQDTINVVGELLDAAMGQPATATVAVPPPAPPRRSTRTTTSPAVRAAAAAAATASVPETAATTVAPAVVDRVSTGWRPSPP
ncbi:hypothetical protein G7085_19345 [Tessaracoccus sp. HDW20]|nr:Rho termination factor N-terminal domain-containing protein [Tessaracoccus coleopterorum]NHB85970.1 hypothetical protein [Tessaracoccus coleopterorum]